MPINPLAKPLTLIDDQTLFDTARRLGLEIKAPIDDQRRLRAENFAGRIVAMLSRVNDRNDMAQVYSVIAAYAYNGDAKIVSRADDAAAA